MLLQPARDGKHSIRRDPRRSWRHRARPWVEHDEDGRSDPGL